MISIRYRQQEDGERGGTNRHRLLVAGSFRRTVRSNSIRAIFNGDNGSANDRFAILAISFPPGDIAERSPSRIGHSSSSLFSLLVFLGIPSFRNDSRCRFLHLPDRLIVHHFSNTLYARLSQPITWSYFFADLISSEEDVKTSFRLYIVPIYLVYIFISSCTMEKRITL